MVGFSTDKGRTALVSRKKFLAGNSNGGVFHRQEPNCLGLPEKVLARNSNGGDGHHGDDGHGMHFSQPYVTKRFRGSWLITFQPFVTCYKFIRDKIVWKLRVEKGSNEHINVSK